ncbi:MAG: hypothetical protein ACXITV_12430 [Luteibaculaceae bacterium]
MEPRKINPFEPGEVDFNIESLLKRAIANFKLTPGKYILVSLLFVAVQLLSIRPGGPIGTILSMLLSPLGVMYLLGYAYQNSRKQFFPVSEIIFHSSRIPMLIILSILISVMTAGGIAFFVLPGVFVAACQLLAPLFLLFGGLGIFESIRASFAYALKNIGKFLLLFLAVIAINLFGLLFLGVGILVTIPITYILFFEVYDAMVGAENQL